MRSSRTSIAASIAARARRRARRASSTASWSKWRARRSSSTTSVRWLRASRAISFIAGCCPIRDELPAAARVLRVYQRSGLAALARGTGILRLLGLQDRERLLPQDRLGVFLRRSRKDISGARTRRARVAFFAGCVAQVTFSELNRATIRVLQANGCEVVVPAGQSLLRRAAGSRGRARRGAQTGAREFCRVCARGFRRDRHQRRRLRLDAQGVHAPLRGGRSGARASRPDSPPRCAT